MKVKVWEWVASLVAAFASGWFVRDISQGLNLHRLYNVVPPTGGPTEVIGLAVLIWLWAKYERYHASMPAQVQFAATPSVTQPVEGSPKE